MTNKIELLQFDNFSRENNLVTLRFDGKIKSITDAQMLDQLKNPRSRDDFPWLSAGFLMLNPSFDSDK